MITSKNYGDQGHIFRVLSNHLCKNRTIFFAAPNLNSSGESEITTHQSETELFTFGGTAFGLSSRPLPVFYPHPSWPLVVPADNVRLVAVLHSCHLMAAPVIGEATLRLTMMRPQEIPPHRRGRLLCFWMSRLSNTVGEISTRGNSFRTLQDAHCVRVLGWQWYPREPHQDNCGANRPPWEPTQTSAAAILLYIIDPLDQQSGRLFPRGAHWSYPNSQRLASSTIPAKQPALRELIFVIWPFAMSPQSVPDTEHPELYTNDPRLFGNEDTHFITTLNHFNLILKFKVPVAPDGGEDGEFIFYSQPHDDVMQHFTDHSLRFSAPSPSLAPQEPMPSASTLVTPFTSSPQGRPLEGPLPDQFSLSVHGCFLHLQHALGDLAPELYPIECGPMYPSDNLPPPGQKMAQNVSSSRLNIISIPLPLSDQWMPSRPPHLEPIHPNHWQVQPPATVACTNARTATACSWNSKYLFPFHQSFGTPTIHPSLLDIKMPPSPDPRCANRLNSSEALPTVSSHFKSFFGGLPYIPEAGGRPVVIDAPGLMAMFSLGWVLGKAYGYACRLYVVLEEALPPPLSVILAYALLSPWDSDVVFNPLVIQLFAPKKLEVLNRWPSKADFVAQINDTTLKELTLQYFNMMPVDIAAMSDDQFSSFSINFT
ncbi:hypothetical protein B0H14DRAFT_2617825 [Mycena olivaceomarginata]|nr:hypothetical protein B0H14DRAFT_2617825 [Mycena olivaceomarginata]